MPLTDSGIPSAAPPSDGTAPGTPLGTAAQVRGSLATYVIRVVLGAVMGVVISRALEPAGRGEYSIIVIIATITTVVGHLSIGNANVAFWSAHRSAIPGTNLILGPPLGAAAAVIVGLVVVALGPGILPIAQPWLLVVAMFTVPVAVSIVHLTMVMLLLGRVDVVNRSLTIATILQCAGLLICHAAGLLSPATVVWLWALAGVLPLLFMLPTLRPHLRPPDLALARRMIGAGAQYHVGLVALYLLLRVDVLLLNALSPIAAVGLYTLAVTIGEMAYAGTDALSQALLRRQAESQIAAAGDLAARTTRVAFIVALVSVGAICAAAPVVVPVLYGDAFRASVPALFALAPGLVAYGATRPLVAFLLRQDRPRLMSALSVAALTVNVTLNLLLIPSLGIVGCALASSAGYITLAATQAFWFMRAADLPLLALRPRWSDVALIVAAARPVSALPADRR
jgi:O-antigen/teichoic acid export membrane protein